MLRGPLQTLQGGRCSLGSVLQASLPAWQRQVQENSGVAWSCLCSVVLFRCHLVYKCACCSLFFFFLADSCLQHVALEDNWASLRHAADSTEAPRWKAVLFIWNNDCRTSCLRFPAFYLQLWRIFFNICRVLPAHKDVLKPSNSGLDAIFIGQNLESTCPPFLSPNNSQKSFHMLQVVLINFLKGKQRKSATECVTLGVTELQAHTSSWPLLGSWIYQHQTYQHLRSWNSKQLYLKINHLSII